MSQGKAKKKLDYNQEEDKSRSQLRIKDVFTLRDIDTLFDDIDADSELGLPLLSPLPKGGYVFTQKINGGSSDSKPPSEQVPKQKQIKANGFKNDGIVDKETQFKGIAPLKTSSPIALATEEAEAGDGLRPMADPLLFGEDEEPIGGDLSSHPCTQQSEPVIKSHYSDSGSLASPPERIEFIKATKPVACSLSRDKDPSPPSSVQDNKQKLPENKQGMDEMVGDTGKGLSFQHKLKKSLMPKSSCSRKPAAAPAPPPKDLEEDFMILDDEAPVLFIIPRKTEVNRNKRTVQKTSKESVPAEPSSTDQLSQSEEDKNHQQVATYKRNSAQVEPGEKQMKGKRGRTLKTAGKDAVTDGLETRGNPVSEELEDEACGRILSQSGEGLKDTASSGKQSRKGKTADELDDTAGEGIAVPPVSRTTKKSSKSSGSQPKRPETKVKKKSSTTPAGPTATKTNKKIKNSKNGEAVSKTNKQMSKRQIEPELTDPICEERNGVEPPSSQDQQDEVTAVNKQFPTKQVALKNPARKQKGNQTKKKESMPEDPPAVASDSSSDGLVISKRKRKPPGAWWLTSQDEGTTGGLSESYLGTAEGPKTSTKIPTKPAAVKVSEEMQFSGPAQGKQKKLKTSHNKLKNAKKVNSGGDDAAALPKTTKKTGRKNIKGAATQLQVPSPTSVSEEEVSPISNERSVISPDLCHYRQHNPVAGEKQLFDKVYTRDGGSAQKQPSSLVRRPESSVPNNVPSKRLKKSHSHWWEEPQSQEPTNGSLSPPSPSPPKSKAPNGAVPGVFLKPPSKTSQKTKTLTRNLKRNTVSTPKSIKRSLASMNAIFPSAKVNMVKSGQRRRKQGRRNILDSLEDQSDYSSENMAHSDDQMLGSDHVSSHFTSCVALEPSEIRNRSARGSSGPNTLSDVDVAFRSGPSSMLELQRQDEDIDLPSCRVTPHVRCGPRVLSQCDLCGPPLQTVVLEEEDWSNLHVWFSHLWPPASKEGRVISPDDFHWHSYGGRAMGHAVDLQSRSFSHGKILLGSFMKKPPQMDHDTVSVFSVISSCVRVDIDSVKSVYNSGQVFMIPSGRLYSIHNLCQEPAVLIYHRTQC